jgi:membrane-associated phospholipid phosphatase
MDATARFRRLLFWSICTVALCSIVVTLCYFFVDKPVAFLVKDQDLPRFVVLKWLTYPPPIIETFAPGALVLLMIRRAFGPWKRWEVVLLVVCVSLLVTCETKDILKYVAGRYWPDTWIDNNPSLLRDDAYGFHPFHDGVAYGDFPSGHLARTLAIVSVFWIAYPNWICRMLCVLAVLAEVSGILGMNYHFVSDVIAGSVVGSIIGAYTAEMFTLSRSCAATPAPSPTPSSSLH